MQVWKQILIFLGIITVITAIAFVVVLRYESQLQKKAIDQENIRSKQLSDYLDRASSSYISKDDFNKFVKDQGINLDSIKSDLAKLNGDIKAISTTQANSTSQANNGIGGTIYIPVPIPNTIPTTPQGTIDIYGWYLTKDRLDLNEKFVTKDENGKDITVNVPIGSATFNASQPKGKEWDDDVYARQYTVNSVIANTEDRNRTITYNQMTIDVNGQKIKVPVDSDVKEIFPESKWRFYMHPDLGLSVGISNYKFATNASLTTPLISYGLYAKSPEFSFLGIGIGADLVNKDFNLVLKQVSYNIGNLGGIFNMFSNTYVTSSLTYGITNKSIGFDFGIKVAL